MILLLLACRHEAPRDTTVNIVSPTRNEATEAELEVVMETGAGVEQVRLLLDDVELFERRARRSMSVDIAVAPGMTHTLVLQGLGPNGGVLSKDSVRFRALEEEEVLTGWGQMTTPSDGARLASPLQVVVQGDAERFSLLVDGEEVRSARPGDVLTVPVEPGVRWLELVALKGDTEVDRQGVSVEVFEPEDPGPADFNARVLDIFSEYPQDGTFTYYWPKEGDWSGSTRDIWYKETLVADDGGYSSCFCSGITWEWWLRAWQQSDIASGGDGTDLVGLSGEELLERRVDWYVRELDGPGPNVALEEMGIGGLVPSTDDWLPGDIVQLWRTSGSGHTAVFLGWETDEEGDRQGFRYASCQGASDGLGESAEYYGLHSGALDPEIIYAARTWLP